MKYPPRNIAIDWINTIWSTNLDPESKLIACNLRRYMNAQNDMAWPSIARICGETGLSESTVRRRLHLLRDEGWLVDSGASDHGTRIYQTSFPMGVSVGQGVSGRLGTPVSVTPELNNELNNTTNNRQTSRPTVEEVAEYVKTRTIQIDPQTFVDYYTANGWKVGRNPMKDWKAAVRTWEKKEKANANTRKPVKPNSDKGRLSAGEQSASHEKKRGSESLPTDHPLWEAWTILADQYGAQWTYGIEPSMGWIYALRDMTGDQLRMGIDNLVHREDNHWPPNANEFADLCRTSFDWERACHKVFTPENKLEDLTSKAANQKIGQDTLKSLMGIFQ